MAAKATYDRHMGEAMCTRLDAIILRDGVDPAIMIEVPPYPENLTRSWELEELPYKEEEEKDKEKADE